jgi:predicted RNA-binding protein
MIYFECYSDEVFLLSLGVPSKNIQHSFSKGNVCNKLQRDRNSVGLVDEDPNEAQPHFIEDLLKSQRIVYKDLNLIFLLDKTANNKLILIRPNIEAWSIKIAIDLKIDLRSSEYHLSSKESELHELLSFSKNQRKLSSFKTFLKDASAHPSILKVKDFIN